MKHGDPVEVLQPTTFGSPFRWTGGYEYVRREPSGTHLVRDTRGSFKGLVSRYGARDVRPVKLEANPMPSGMVFLVGLGAAVALWALFRKRPSTAAATAPLGPPPLDPSLAPPPAPQAPSAPQEPVLSPQAPSAPQEPVLSPQAPSAPQEPVLSPQAPSAPQEPVLSPQPQASAPASPPPPTPPPEETPPPPAPSPGAASKATFSP